MERKVIAFLCRTSDRTLGAARGAEALARLVATQAHTEPVTVGSFGEPRANDWSEDLRDSRGCILEAGGQVEDALNEGRVPLLFAGDCSICLTTLPAALRERPEAKILWLDAHADFNSPETSPSGYLGGMCLAAACGVWDAKLGPTVDSRHVVMCGVRDVDPGEVDHLARAGIETLAPEDVPVVLAGAPVYVHLDLDVVDPDEMPARFPAEGGLASDTLREVLESVVADCELVGAEVTSLEERDFAPLALDVLTPLLEEARVSH